jgi:hypothetical protein
MMQLLQWVESTAMAAWVRESVSLWAYPGMLSLHAIGLAFAVGVSFAIDLRVLGVGQGVPVAALRGFVPVLWIGFWVNAVSGSFLLVAYATTLLTNPIFLVKLSLIGLAVIQVVLLNRRLFAGGRDSRAREIDGKARWLAVCGLGLWTGAILGGRMTAYLDLVAKTLGLAEGG